MAVQLYTNNATGTLATLLAAIDTALTLNTGEGAAFPNPSGGDFFIATLENIAGDLEVIKVTARSADVFTTIVRAQEGTTAIEFAAGSRVECRLTAGSMTGLLQRTEEAIYNGVTKHVIALTYGAGIVGQDIGAGVKHARIDLNDDNGVNLGQVFSQTSDSMQLVSNMNGLPVMLRGKDVGGVVRALFVGDPDAAASLYYAGVEKLRTTISGAQLTGNLEVSGYVTVDGSLTVDDGIDGELHIVDGSLEFWDAVGGVIEGYIAISGISSFELVSLVNGYPFKMTGKSGAGVTREVFFGDPDAQARLYFAGVEALSTESFGVQVYGEIQVDGRLVLDDPGTALITNGPTTLIDLTNTSEVVIPVDLEVNGDITRGGVPVLTTVKYASAQQAVSLAGSMAHSLGTAPDVASVQLVCVTTDLGYAVDDAVDLSSVQQGEATVWSNATHVGWALSMTTLELVNKAGTTTAAIDPSKWRLVAKAIRFA